MAVAYRSAATAGYTTATNTTVGKPSGTAENDILIAGIHTESDVAVTAPDGTWTLITDVDQATVDQDWKIYWKRAGASEGTDYTWTHNSTWRSGVIVAISGATTTGDPQDATIGTDNDNNATATVNIPSITTGTNGSLVIALHTEYNSDLTSSQPTDWNERVDVSSIHVHTKTQTTAGATGATTATLSDASYICTAVLAIKEAGVAAVSVTLDPATATATGIALANVNAPVTRVMDTAAITASGIPFTVSLPVSGIVVVLETG